MTRGAITVAWFSAGVSSAVAIKLVSREVDKIMYIHIGDQHEDTMRFVKDCENWFGQKIEILQSPYKTVENACRASAYINGVRGASCTGLLKRRVRKDWERANQDSEITYIWGMDKSEVHRPERLRETMPDQNHRCPLIEQGIDKQAAHKTLNASGIKRPAMYELGYHNNNCVGCVKGGMGYFNRIRIDFPDIFNARARLEREIGASCINGVYLDELAPDRGRHAPPIVDDCGILCEVDAIV